MLTYFYHRQARIWLLFALCFGALSLCTRAQVTATWTGKANDSLWTSSKNWDTRAVPGSNDTAIIDLSGSNLVILNTNLFIGTIELGGQGTNILQLTGVSIQCTGSISISNNGVLQVTGNSVVVGGTVQNSGTIMVPANQGTQSLTLMSYFTNYGVLDAETNSVLSLPGTNSIIAYFADGSTFNGSGTVLFPSGNSYINCANTMTVNGAVEFQQAAIFGISTWAGSGLFRWDSGVIDNANFAPGFHVEVDSSNLKFVDGTCTNQGVVRWLAGSNGGEGAGTNGLFYNLGVFQIEGDCQLASFANFQNAGTIRIPPDLGTVSLTLLCGFTNYGAIDVESNSTFLIERPVLFPAPSFESGTLFEGLGTVRFPTNSDPNEPVGPIVCNGTITVDGTVELNVGLQSGGAVWTGSGVLRWWGSPLFNPTFASGFHVEISNNDPKALVGIWTNKGTISFFDGDFKFYGRTGDFYNEGVFQIESNCDFTSGLSNFINSGTIDIPAGVGELSLTIDCGFTNSGAIDVETNSLLDLLSTYSSSATFQSGTLFSGPGIVRFPLNSEGPAFWNGNITVNGTLDMGAATAPDGNSVWNGSGVLLMRGGLVDATFGPGFNVQLYSSGLDGVCTNQGTVRCLATGPFGDPIGGFQFYNSGLFQVETNFELNGGSFQNTGTIRVPVDFGELSFTTDGGFTNFGVIDVETNSLLDLASTYSGSATFESGTLFAGPGIVRFPLNSEGPAYWNGNITVNGTLDMGAATAPDGNSVWNGSGVLLMRGGLINVTFGPGFNVQLYSSGLDGVCTNQGTVRCLATGPFGDPIGGFQFYNSGLFQMETNFELFGGGFQNTGTIRVPAEFGELSFAIEGDLTNCGAIDIETNSILDITTPYSPTSVAFESGSDFSGPGILTATGYVFCDGTITVNGTFEYNSAGTLETGSTFWAGSGLLRWTGGGLPVVTFAPGFNVEISGADPKYLTVCTNEGTLRWLGGESLNFLTTGQFYNSGLIQIEADGNWNDTPIDNEPSGIFRQLAGAFSIASLTNCGTVDLQGGELNVTTNFFSGSNSVYQITLSGTTPGTNYNQLTAQTLALNGSLKVVLTNGFLPVSGNSFVIANDSSQSGTFSNLTVPTFQSNLVLNVRYSPGSVLLEVDPVLFGLTNSIYTNGAFQFSLNGLPASAYDIQASSNLIDWITIGTNSPFTGSLNFTDTNAATWDHRFYRARIFP